MAVASIVVCAGIVYADLFTPTFLCIFYVFWAPKYALRITITELRTQENPILAKFSFILMFIMSAMTRNRMIVIVNTVPD